MPEKVLHIPDRMGIFPANDGQPISRRMGIETNREIAGTETGLLVSIRVGGNGLAPLGVFSLLICAHTLPYGSHQQVWQKRML